jgi:hypothetical protein
MRPAAYEVSPIEVLELARVILFHYTQHGAVEPPPITGKSLNCAKRLLSLYSKEKGGKLCWGHTVKWRENLKAAGLDPDTLDVRNPLLWERASKQLLEHGTLYWRASDYDEDEDLFEPRSFKGKIALRARERRERQERQKAQQELEERQTQQITGPPSAKDAIRQMFGLPFR